MFLMIFDTVDSLHQSSLHHHKRRNEIKLSDCLNYDLLKTDFYLRYSGETFHPQIFMDKTCSLTVQLIKYDLSLE